MKNTLSIRIPEPLRRKVKALCRVKNQSLSDVVRDSLQHYVAIERFHELRKKTLPFAEAQGYLTDEDVFEVVS